MRRLRFAAPIALGLSLAAFACTKFSSSDGAPDAGSEGDDAAAPDGAPFETGMPGLDGGDASAPCDPNGPFLPPEPFGVLGTGTYDVWGALITNGAVIFGDHKPGNTQLRWLKLDGTEMPAGTPQLVDLTGNLVNSASYPTLSADGLMLYGIGSTDGGAAQLFSAKRSSVQAFSFEPTGYLSTNATPLAPHVHGKRLFYADIVNGNHDLFALDLANLAAPPVAIASINTRSDEQTTPVVSANGLHLYFATGVGGPLTMGGDDVWVATRSADDVTFGDATPIPSLNSGTIDRPTWVSPDECTMLVITDRASPGGSKSIYIAKRPPLH